MDECRDILLHCNILCSQASPQIWKKNRAGEVSGSAFQLGRKIAMVLNYRRWSCRRLGRVSLTFKIWKPNFCFTWEWKEWQISVVRCIFSFIEAGWQVLSSSVLFGWLRLLLRQNFTKKRFLQLWTHRQVPWGRQL